MMKGEEEGTVLRRRDEDVCKISVDDTYEGVSCCLNIFSMRGSLENLLSAMIQIPGLGV